jgi:hypothetical protein
MLFLSFVERKENQSSTRTLAGDAFLETPLIQTPNEKFTEEKGTSVLFKVTVQKNVGFQNFPLTASCLLDHLLKKDFCLSPLFRNEKKLTYEEFIYSHSMVAGGLELIS